MNRNDLIRSQLRALEQRLRETPRTAYNTRSRLHDAIRRKKQRLSY